MNGKSSLTTGVEQKPVLKRSSKKSLSTNQSPHQRILVLLLLAVALSTPFLIIRQFLINQKTLDNRGKASQVEVEAVIQVYPDQENHPLKDYGTNIPATDSEIEKAVSKRDTQLYDQLIDFYNQLGFSYFRFPNGAEIRFYDWTSPKGSYMPWPPQDDFMFPSVEEMLDFAQDANSEIIFELSVLGLLPNTPEDDTTKVYHDLEGVTFKPTEEQLRNFIRTYTVQRKDLGQKYIKYYELGNEEWLIKNNTLNRMLTAQEYQQAAFRLAEIIREETNNNPEIVIIGVSALGEGVWGASGYKNSSEGLIDRINFHYYHRSKTQGSTVSGKSLYDFVGETPLLEFFKSAFPSHSRFQYPALTEWNMWCFGDQAFRHFNLSKLEHSLYTVGSTISLIKSEIPFSTVHKFYLRKYQRDDICNLLQAPDDQLVLAPQGLGFKIINEHFGDVNVKSIYAGPEYTFAGEEKPSGDALWVSSSKKTGSNDEIITFIINRTPDQDITAKIVHNQVEPYLSYQILTLTGENFSSSLENISWTENETQFIEGNEIVYTIPAHSLIIIKANADNSPPVQDACTAEDISTCPEPTTECKVVSCNTNATPNVCTEVNQTNGTTCADGDGVCQMGECIVSETTPAPTSVPTATPMPREAQLSLSLSLDGIPYTEGSIKHHPQSAGHNIKLQLSLVNTTKLVAQQIVDFTYDKETGTYTNKDSIILGEIVPGPHIVGLKGPMHLAWPICYFGNKSSDICTFEQLVTQTTNYQKGRAVASNFIVLEAGNNSFNLSTKPLPVGDLPISGTNKNQQDGKVDVKDYSYMLSCIGEKSRTPACLSRADVDFSDQVNNIDLMLLRRTLSSVAERI